MGVEGFSSDASLLYHRHLPTAIVSSEVYDGPTYERRPNHPLKPRHLRTHKLDGAGAAARHRRGRATAPPVAGRGEHWCCRTVGAVLASGRTH